MRLTVERARQLAVMGQLLDADRPTDILDTVRRLGFVQIDPTAVVARTEHLVLWSRLASGYKADDLGRLLHAERSLFEYRAFIYPTEDYPLLRPRMEGWPQGGTPAVLRVRRWLDDNETFRAYVIGELRRRGPLRSRDLEDRAVTGWQSSGWTHERNVGQMLEFLWARGEIAVAGRDGTQRIWDLAERVLPVDAPRVTAEAAELRRGQRRLRALGIARPGRASGIPLGIGIPVEVEGLRGRWVADPELLDRPFSGRTAVLSPFDRLIYDRSRAEELFGFEYRLEIYVPVAKRRWGYFVLPVLFGDRIVARADARADRAAALLRVPALHLEPGSGAVEALAAEAELQALAAWLGLDGVQVERTIPAPKGTLSQPES